MDDRALLEAAARAAGIVIATWSNCQAGGFLAINCMPERRNRFWNPLTDDGDALRLAVKLRMELSIDDKHAWAMATGDPGAGHADYIGSDPYAATRRAIVRAAAAMAQEAG